MSLHDFGVDCRDHLAQYQAKPWAHIVAPQGRRSYGFDWEDWSAKDALAALYDARRRNVNNPLRTYLTGKGMGGHGAWLLGAKRPDMFAAVGPANGWLSYWSIDGGMPSYESPTPIQNMTTRPASSSDTLALLRNLAMTSIYIMHDAEDRDVAQSRFARRRLGDFHPDFVYFERYDSSREEATPDWPGMMRFFREHETSARGAVRRIDFTTTDPGQSSRCHWARIEAQEKSLAASRIVLEHDERTGTISGRTENVARMSLEVSELATGPRSRFTLQFDSSRAITLSRPKTPRGQLTVRVWLSKDEGGRWRQTPTPRGLLKTPRRQGGFKSLFDRGAVLVYGTMGNEEENRWAAAKARYDAQTFWVRGAGTLQVIPDTQFQPRTSPNQNVVLYGNADTNRAWPLLLSGSPVQINAGHAYVGARPEAGENLGLLMVRPRPGSRSAMVGVVGGSGIAGMRLTNRLRYFFAGIGYPDLMLIGDRAPADGVQGLRAAGYFDAQWSLEEADIVWRDLAL